MLAYSQQESYTKGLILGVLWFVTILLSDLGRVDEGGNFHKVP